MLKKIFLVLLITSVMPCSMMAEWVPLDNKSTSKVNPEVTIISQDNDGIVLKIDISGFDISELNADGKTFQSVDLFSDIFTTEPGFPEVPHIAKVLAIPDQASISLEIIETGKVQTFKNIHLPPARLSWIEGQPETPYIENAKAFQSRSAYPGNYASMDAPSIFRDFRIARLSIFPIRYIANKEEIQVVSSITVRVTYNYGKGDVINPKMTSRKKISPSFSKLYRSFIFNYQDVLDRYYNGDENGREVMLCIMPDEFVTSFEPYADWKRQTGIDVQITKFSDIGANSNNPMIIKNHISYAYNNWEHPPTYVLLVGDNGVFPIKIIDYDYSFATENYFVEIEGDDFFPEMMVGRLTNQGDYRMRVMLNKFMKYEKHPYTADADWFKKGICCSNDAYLSQISTKRFTANIMMEDGNFTSVDTLMSDSWGGSECSINLNDVKDALNEGRSWLNYRGEGWTSGWWASCYPFSTSDVSSINNGEKLTFITSIGCGVAMFNASGGNCFGEEWVQLGSLDEARGSIAFIGPTSNTHTTYNNRIDKGIYVGMFQEGMETPGEAMLRGKLYMYNVFGDDPWVEYHYRVFCILGDPSVHIWKDVPMNVNVVHESSIPIGFSQPEFTITFESTGLPVANAQVLLIGDDIYATGTSDSTGKLIIDVIPETEGELTVTVRGGNVIPYQSTMLIEQAAEHIAPDGEPIVVDLDGNTDGLINPNENCNITFTIKNWGNQTSNNVQGTLSAVESDFIEIITTDPVSFGNISSGSSATGNPFQFYVLPNCPLDEIITLKLHITSNTSEWEYDFIEEVVGCELVYKSTVIDDEGSVNRNYRMDPGETVKVYISIENSGRDIAPDVLGILSSNDPYITIDDSTGSFGTIDTADVAINTTSYFIVTVNSSCPTDYFPEYSLMLYTQNGNYPYETVCNFTIPVSVPISTDYTGPDEYGYYAYSIEDSIYEQAPDYDWIEINETGIAITIPNTSEYTQTVTLPFIFKYYGINYENVRISTDGWLAFGSGSQTSYSNNVLPHNDNINNMVAVLWEDFFNDDINDGDIYYYHDVVNHSFIVEWDSVAHWSSSDVREIFQAILLDPAYYDTPTGDGEIIFQYKKLSRPESSSIGIENHTQDIGILYVYDNNYDATASLLKSGTAIKFTTTPPHTTVSIDENIGTDSRYSVLDQNYPNPFITQTWISYELVEQSNVTLKIYNLSGDLIQTLFDGRQAEGKHTTEWNGINAKGNRVVPGIYIYQLKTDDIIETRKMFMVR